MLFAWLLHRGSPIAFSQSQAAAEAPSTVASPAEVSGERVQLTYNQWLDVLKQEARVAAEKQPPQLVVLAGDSLSLWFPAELLPQPYTWLNQGISGETSYGLLRRINLLDDTKPEIVFVLIGINDLIRGVKGVTLVANQQEIVRHLKRVHPKARIVLQSLLPHGGSRVLEKYGATVFANRPIPKWVYRLPDIPNSQIRKLNQKLALVAEAEGVEYLDLHPLFTDVNGDLLTHLSADGLHLNRQGYEVWRNELQKKAEAKSDATVLERSP